MFSTFKSATCIVFVTLIAVTISRAATPARCSVDDGIKAILTQEDAVRTLTIAGEWKASSWENGAWVIDRDQQATVIYEGVPATRIRIDCQKDIAPWENGPPGGLSFEAFTTVYNGRVGVTLITKNGTPEKQEKASDVMLSHGQPMNLYDASYTSGWRYTIFGNQEADRFEERQYSERFSKFLERNKDKAVQVQENGASFLKLTVQSRLTGRELESSYWLDPTKGYSIVKVERAILTDRKSRGVIRIADFYTLAPNVYYPKTVTVEGEIERNGSWGPSQKNVIEISEVDVNSPAINENTFKLRIPSHSSILDQETGEVVPVTGTADEQGKVMQQEVEDARRLMKEGEVHSSTPDTASATTQSR